MLEQEQGICGAAGIVPNRKKKKLSPHQRLAAVMFLLAGILCLAGAGIYFYGRTQAKTVREYDGVLVREQPDSRSRKAADWPAGKVTRCLEEGV